MPDFLRGLLARLFGAADDDPMGGVSVDQVAILLKSIEDKYTALQEENARLLARLEGRRDDREELLERLACQQREIEALQRALADRTEAETQAETTTVLRELDTVPPAPLAGPRAGPDDEGEGLAAPAGASPPASDVTETALEEPTGV
ncbi:MAG: hypothetical protein VKQ33_06305 [Candidatus Sericytochromatia bacterium]|nr:hypothetical protein [Candidatus Sericytochromatia bacterium]